MDQSSNREPAGITAEPDIDSDQLRHSLRKVAHDLRSSLGPLVGYAELIVLVGDDRERVESYAAKIEEAALRLQALADTLTERVMSEAKHTDDTDGSATVSG